MNINPGSSNPFEQLQTAGAVSDPGVSADFGHLPDGTETAIKSTNTEDGSRQEGFLAEEHSIKLERGSKERPNEISITLDAVAKRLLAENFILTALELHSELLESGKELHRLRDFFSNPANFENQTTRNYDLLNECPNMPRSSSVATFDSIDDFVPSGSDEAEQQSADKVAILEFELRKARQQIHSLRTQLTEASEGQGAIAGDHVLGDKEPRSGRHAAREQSIDQAKPSVCIAIKPFEQKALNFLVHEYLLENDMKLTAVTLCEEVSDQDFDDWDDIGVDVPRPLNLLTMYREHARTVPSQVQMKDVGTTVDMATGAGDDFNTDDLFGSATSTTDLLNRLNSENATLMERNVALCERINQLNATIESLEQRLASSESQTHTGAPIVAVETRQESLHAFMSRECVGKDEWTKNRSISTNFIEAVSAQIFPYQNVGDSRLQKDIGVVDRDPESGGGFVSVVCRALPYIVPNVLLNKRHELLPIILCAALQQPDSKEREAIISMLFNLVKKPDADQRRVMLASCFIFAGSVGSVRTETELLPLCWEQMGSKYVERRILVAETCMVLAPFLDPAVLGSLVLSTLQEMLNSDRSELVRNAAVRSLAILCMYIEDREKFAQIGSLVNKAVLDPDDQVATISQQLLLPTFAQWALELGKLQFGLLGAFSKKIADLVISNEGANKGEIVQATHEGQLCAYWKCLQSLLGVLYWSVLSTGPFNVDESSEHPPEICENRYPKVEICCQNPEAMCGSKERFGRLTSAYDAYTAHEWFNTWDSFDYALKNLVPDLIAVLVRQDPCLDKLLSLSIDWFSGFCRFFGEPVSRNLMQKTFLSLLVIPPKSSDDDDSIVAVNLLRSSVLPTYVVGVLCTLQAVTSKPPTGGPVSVYSYLRNVVLSLAERPGPHTAIIATFKHLSLRLSDQQQLLNLVWDLVMSKTPAVKILCAEILGVLVKTTNADTLASIIVPGLITLSSDIDVQVRGATIAGFGAAFGAASEAQLVQVEDKIRLQLASFFEDPVLQGNSDILVNLIRTLANTAPALDAKFREDFLLPRYAIIAAHNQHESYPQIKDAVSLALFEAYSALSCCYVSPKAVAESFLPGIRTLQRDLDPKRARVAGSIIKDLESKLKLAPGPGGVVQESSGGVGNFSNQLPDVDAMKNRMMDKFKDIKYRMDQQKGGVPSGIFSRKP